MLPVSLIFLDMLLRTCRQVAKFYGSEGVLTAQRSLVRLMHFALRLENQSGGVEPQQSLNFGFAQVEQEQPNLSHWKGSVAAYLSSKVGYFWSSARRRTTGRFLSTGPAIEMESDM